MKVLKEVNQMRDCNIRMSLKHFYYKKCFWPFSENIHVCVKGVDFFIKTSKLPYGHMVDLLIDYQNVYHFIMFPSGLFIECDRRLQNFVSSSLVSAFDPEP